MKKLFSFFVILWMALGVCFAQGIGASVNRYSLSMEEGTYRSLSTDATILFAPTVDTQINHKYIVKADSLAPVSVGVKGTFSPSFPNLKKQPASIRLDEDFIYGTVKVRGIGVSTDGFLFFGDTMTPAYYGSKPGEENIIYHLNTKVKNFLFFNMADRKEDGDYTTPLYARQGSKIGYEKEGELLIIAYENLYIKESETEEQQISWNYQINLETGAIALQTKGFYTDATKDYPARSFSYGLVGTLNSDQVWLAGFNPLKKEGSKKDLLLAKDSLREGALYSFTAPEKCKAVADPTIDWKISVTDMELSLAGTTWTGAACAVFLLSENETLTTEEQPRDGKTFAGWNSGREIIKYPSKPDALDSIWVWKGLLAENVNGDWKGLNSGKNQIENLKPETDYWIHAYVYDNTCLAGPVYGTELKQKITMGLPVLSSQGMSIGEITDSSLKVTLPALEEGTYMVAISEKAATYLDKRDLKVRKNILKNGTTYEVGDKVGNGTMQYVGVGEGTYEIKGLDSGTAYYVWVWRAVGSGENIRYNAGCAELAEKTVYNAPVTLDFKDDEQYTLPVGWLSGLEGNASCAAPFPEGWQIVMYKENEAGGSGGLKAAKAPAAGTLVFFSQFFVDPNIKDDMYPQLIKAYAISPMAQNRSEDDLSVAFNVGLYTTNDKGVPSAYKMVDGDSLIISWAESKESTDWQTVALVDKKATFDKDGFISVLISGFNPTGYFCFKIEAVHKATSRNDVVGCAIQNIQIMPDLPCKTPRGITVEQEDITHSSALISWQDGNPDGAWAKKFLVKYRPDNAEQWIQDSVIDTQIQLKGLQHSTDYIISIQAVCGGENGNSLETTGGFSTKIALKIPYEYESGVQNALPTGSRNMRGIPGSDIAEINPVREVPAIGWAIDVDATMEGDNTLLLNLEANANTWLVLPILLPDVTARVKLSLDLATFGLSDALEAQEALKTHDSLWVFVSNTGDFKADRKTVGVVNIDSLHYKVANDEMLYETVDMEFSVDEDKDYHIAFYVPGKGASADFDGTKRNMLAIGSIEMTNAAIEYPAVTDIQVSNLSQTGFRLSWKGQADSYKILLKEATDSEYETISETTTSHTFENLKKSTRYTYRIYGIYNGTDGRMTEEATVTTLGDEPVVETVATPEFSPEAGIVEAGTVIKISCATEGAAIYYTTDGSTPTVKSKYYLFGVSVDTTTVIKAIAMKEGMNNSAMAEARFEVGLANESAELADVSLYPNPTSGSFKVVVPVRAQVEVFTSNGMLVKAFTMPAGTQDVVLDNSGIYFVRFTTQNGSVAVKRLVVR